MGVAVIIIRDRIIIRRPYINDTSSSPEIIELIRGMFIDFVDRNKMYVHHHDRFKYCITDGDKLEFVIDNDYYMSIRIRIMKYDYKTSYEFIPGSKVIDILNKEFDKLEYGSDSQ